jgi:hypothetical protein
MKTIQINNEVSASDDAKENKKLLEEQVHIVLLGMNREDRRAWLARMRRKAGKARHEILTAKK